MMTNYYITADSSNNPNNNHEVHTSGCQWLPSEGNRGYLGSFNTCIEAIKAAKNKYSKVDGCAICCPECHNG